MKKPKIVVCCGANMATSTIAYNKLSEILKKNNLQADLVKCSIRDLAMYPTADLIVSTTVVSKTKTPVLIGLPLITGVGADKFEKQFVETVRSIRAQSDGNNSEKG